MPKSFERKVKARGGAKRWRNKSLDGSYLKCAVVSKKGEKGGTTVCYKKTKKKR